MEFSLVSKTVYPDHCDPLYLLRILGEKESYSALLESVDREHGSNDFSFVAIGARDVLTVINGQASGSTLLPMGSVSDPLQPFESFVRNGEKGAFLQMGYIGSVSFESVRFFDSIDLVPDPTVPDAEFFLPEVLLKIDHKKRSVTIISHEETLADLEVIESTIVSSPFFPDNPPPEALPLPSLHDIQPYRQMSREQYTSAVEQIQEGIRAGETFQVVLSQELRLESDNLDASVVYDRLRAINPSPYMYYYRTPQRTIVGASPETLLRVNGRDITYRPIAGTRKRTGDSEIDTRMQADLLADQKERCEHQMLVDLGRNDVGKVAEIGSVQVENPFHIERYSHVFHIVSDIRATLAEGKTCLDALRAVFPAGTLSGAPKLRALEYIRGCEASPRGIYGGAFGYIDATGNMDMAIVIRTMHFDGRGVSIRVGAGIVHDSVPELEDDECLHKARSCLAAIALATEHGTSLSPP